MPCTHITQTTSKHCPKCFEVIEPLRDEIELQRDCKMIFDQNFKENAVLVHHQNNAETGLGGIRNKALGVRKGIPDFQVLCRKPFFIEMKFGKGVLSKDQKEMISRLESWGFKVFICRTLIEFMDTCKKNIV